MTCRTVFLRPLKTWEINLFSLLTFDTDYLFFWLKPKINILSTHQSYLTRNVTIVWFENKFPMRVHCIITEIFCKIPMRYVNEKRISVKTMILQNGIDDWILCPTFKLSSFKSLSTSYNTLTLLNVKMFPVCSVLHKNVLM